MENTIPGSSIPISDIVSCSVPSFVIAMLNVSSSSTSSFIVVGITIERPQTSPTVTVKEKSSEIVLSLSKIPVMWMSHSSFTWVFTPAVILLYNSDVSPSGIDDCDDISSAWQSPDATSDSQVQFPSSFERLSTVIVDVLF